MAVCNATYEFMLVDIDIGESVRTVMVVFFANSILGIAMVDVLLPLPSGDKFLRGLILENFGQICKIKSTQNVTFSSIRKNKSTQNLSRKSFFSFLF